MAFQVGDFADAEMQLSEARERFLELGDHAGVSWAEGLQAWVSYFQRRFEEAEELATAVESDARRWGDPWATMMMQTLLANLRLWTGRLAEAEQFAERALAGFRDVNDRYGVMQALGPLNRARAGLGKKADAKRGAEEAIALGGTFGELGMALQAAAGVAMHLGGGEMAVTLAEQVIERNLASGTNPDEAYVLLALGCCQTGALDEAVAAIERIDVEDFPFGRSARALVWAVAGDVAAAIEDAELVERERGASYFDLAVARLAGVLAADRAGDVEGSRYWLEALTSLASSVGDVVFIAIAQRLHDRPVEVRRREVDAGGRLAAGRRHRRRRLTPTRGRAHMNQAPTGLIVGRFDPPHLGHSFLIEQAALRCGRLVVYVNSGPADAVPGDVAGGVAGRAAPGRRRRRSRPRAADRLRRRGAVGAMARPVPAALAVRTRSGRDLVQRSLRCRAGAPPRCRGGDRGRRSGQRPDQRHHDQDEPGCPPRPAGATRAGLGRGELALSARAGYWAGWGTIRM